MLKIIAKTCLISALSLALLACATTTSRQPKTKTLSINQESHLEQGKRDFDDGYYKRAMHELLPIACDGNAEAQYAVGYMYYYGYGVAQDTDVGHFWIKRSANQGFAPAVRALAIIDRGRDDSFRARDRLFNQ